jgi:hypothetical protein
MLCLTQQQKRRIPVKLNTKKMARVKFGNFFQLPDDSGIYLVENSDGKIIYVGISTTSLRDRWANHEKTDSCREHGANWLAYQTYDDNEELIQREKDCIVKYSPVLNNQNVVRIPIRKVFDNPADCLKRLHELRVIEKQVASEIESIKDEALEILETEYDGSYTTKEFSFAVVTKSCWQYPDECKQAVKQIKKEYEKNGQADQYYSKYALHRPLVAKEKSRSSDSGFDNNINSVA